MTTILLSLFLFEQSHTTCHFLSNPKAKQQACRTQRNSSSPAENLNIWAYADLRVRTPNNQMFPRNPHYNYEYQSFQYPSTWTHLSRWGPRHLHHRGWAPDISVKAPSPEMGWNLLGLTGICTGTRFRSQVYPA